MPWLGPVTGVSRQPGGLLAPCSCGLGSSILYSKSQAPALPRADAPTSSHITERGRDSGQKWERAGQLGL